MKSSYFYTITLSFIAGVLLRSFFVVSLYFVFGVFLLVLAIVALNYFLATNRSKIVTLFCFSILFFGIGIIRYDVADSVAPIIPIEQSLGEKIIIEGVVIDEPEQRARNLRFLFLPEQIEDDVIDIKTKIVVSADRYADVSYGDRVTLTGVVRLPKNFMIDSGSEFDYVSYLAKDGIRYEMKNPVITIVAHHEGKWIVEKLFALKHRFAASINRSLPAPESMLANGILLGSRASFSQDLTDAFVRTSTIHMVALSGYNVTIVAETIISLFTFLPISFASALGIIGIVLFALLAGGGSTVLRASIMAVLVIISRYIGRSYDVGRALTIAGAVMVAINPKILVFDSSFQLSFLATLGIVYVAPMISVSLGWITERFGLREIVSGTLAAQLATSPLIIYKTGIFSLVSLPANILILPLVPHAMLFGFLTGALGIFSYLIALPFAYTSYGLLHYMLGVVEWFSAFSFAAITIKQIPALPVIACYISLAWWVMRWYRKS